MADDVTTVDIPGHGPVDFPSSMSATDIKAASKRLYEQAQSDSTPASWQSRYQPSTATPASQGGPWAETGRYYKELLTGEGTARGQAADYLKHEATAFGPAALSGLTALYQIPMSLYNKGVTQTGVDMAKGLWGTAKGITEGDPDAVGAGLGMVVAPKVMASGLRGINRGTQYVADSPRLQTTAGMGVGAEIAKQTGLHPLIGTVIGAQAGPAIGQGAAATADATGAILDRLGIRQPPTGTFLPQLGRLFRRTEPQTTMTGAGPVEEPSSTGTGTETAEGSPSSTTSTGEDASVQGMSAADRAATLKRYPNLPPAALAKMEQQAMADQLTKMGQVDVHAVQPTPTTAEASVPIAEEGPLTVPNRDIGAEKVGRQMGMTTQEMRDARGSLHHEPTGEASPKLPTKSINRMVDALREMPPGPESPERLAYVDKATSPKAHGAVDTVREALDRARQRLSEELPPDIMDKIKLGLIPPAALTARWAMLNGLNPVASHDQSSQ